MMSQSSTSDNRNQPRARYKPPQARNLRDQQIFLYDRTGGGFGGAEIVTDSDTIEVLQDAIDLALRHLFSPRSMRLMNLAFQQDVSEFGEWIHHGPRLAPGLTEVPLSQVLADQLQRRSVNDRLQLVVDRTLPTRGAEGEVDSRQPYQLRINSDVCGIMYSKMHVGAKSLQTIEAVVEYRRTGNPCAVAGLVFLAGVICHEAVHAIRRTTVRLQESEADRGS